MRKRAWKGKLAELLLVNAEVDRELTSYVNRENAMQNRATVLVGAASVVGAIQLSDGFAPLNVVNLILSFIAAVLGVLVLFPRTGDAPDPGPMHQAVLCGTPPDEAVNRMIGVKLDILYEDEKSLATRGIFARVGFIVLAASILAAAIGAFVPGEGDVALTGTGIEVVTDE